MFADKQEINIKEEVDSYQIAFNYESDDFGILYNKLEFKQSFDKRTFYLYKNDMRAVILQNCEGKNNKLTCNINKEKISEFLSFSGEKFYLAEKLDLEGLYLFNSVLDIKINYIITQKEISIKIGNLLTPVISKNEFIAYETNKGDISSLITDYFELETEQNKKFKCIFKKNNNVNNILLLCNATEDGKYSLGKISTITYDKININYKFLIDQSENKEEFTVEDNGTKIFDLNPLELNFKENDSYVINYETEYPERLNGIKLNNDSSFELSCENKIWYKECTVNKTHFTKSGYYYTYHNNYLGSKTISYEVPLIHVIIEEKGNNPENEDGDYGLVIGLSVAGGILVLCAIGFLVWHCLRKRTNADIEGGNKDDLLPLSSQEKE